MTSNEYNTGVTIINNCRNAYRGRRSRHTNIYVQECNVWRMHATPHICACVYYHLGPVHGAKSNIQKHPKTPCDLRSALSHASKENRMHCKSTSERNANALSTRPLLSSAITRWASAQGWDKKNITSFTFRRKRNSAAAPASTYGLEDSRSTAQSAAAAQPRNRCAQGPPRLLERRSEPCARTAIGLAPRSGQN